MFISPVSATTLISSSGAIPETFVITSGSIILCAFTCAFIKISFLPASRESISSFTSPSFCDATNSFVFSYKNSANPAATFSPVVF